MPKSTQLNLSNALFTLSMNTDQFNVVSDLSSIVLSSTHFQGQH